MELSQLWLLSKVTSLESQNEKVFLIWKTLVKFFVKFVLFQFKEMHQVKAWDLA